jgi:Domain of unknown function (DUF6048)
MKLRISNYFFSLTLAISSPLFGQVAGAKDSIRSEFKPTGIRIGMDMISIVKTFSSDNFKGWELQGDVDFRNYYLTAEVGHWSRHIELNNGDYDNNGNYYRIGVDVNFLKKDPVKNMFFFGFRIGHSKYDEKLRYSVSAPSIFRPSYKTIENRNLTSNWLELTTGLKVRINGSFWMGYTARIKFAPGLDKDQQLQTYDIPGYGLTFKKPWWGFDYYVMFRIPLKKGG